MSTPNKKEELPLHLNQWVVMNTILYFYKVMALLSMFMATACLIYLFMLSTKPPIVFESKNSGLENAEHAFVEAHHAPITITKSDLEGVIRNFIFKRYEWNNFKIENILSDLKFVVSEGLLKQIKHELQTQQNFKQRILINNIDIGEKDILASFDRIIEIEGVKVISVMQISLEIIEGERNAANPLGLYINGVVEYEKN